MKSIITFLTVVCLSIPAFAVGPAPKELEGGVITVTLKDGKVYTFSSDEYAVVKRGQEPELILEAEEESEKVLVAVPDLPVHRNIISIGVIHSQNGFNVGSNPSVVSVETKEQLGGQLQYQRRMDKRVYVGGQIDTNGGVGASMGVGF